MITYYVFHRTLVSFTAKSDSSYLTASICYLVSSLSFVYVALGLIKYMQVKLCSEDKHSFLLGLFHGIHHYTTWVSPLILSAQFHTPNFSKYSTLYNILYVQVTAPIHFICSCEYSHPANQAPGSKVRHSENKKHTVTNYEKWLA